MIAICAKVDAQGQFLSINPHVRCPCAQHPELRPGDLHAFACLGLGGHTARTAISMRHNNLCHKLGSILQSQGARDLCYEPQMNEHNADNARALRTDVRAVVDGFTHYFDVSVVTAPLHA